jgi:5-hydroxyisourate hydrolase-like protein (transthyretin family)
MMKRLIFVLLIIIAIGLPGNLSAQDSGQGIIEGQVVNETEGGGSVAGLDVGLIGLVEDEVKEIQTGQTDEEGKFRFADISVTQSYMVRVCYMQIDYYYPIDFSDGETEKFIEVPVCDTTTSDQAIRVYLSHIILRAEDGYFSVKEVMWLLNEGDKTYIGSEETSFGGVQGTLVFTLPEGATDFGVSEELAGDYFTIDNNTVTNTLVFPPGEKEIVFYYKLYVPDSGDLVIELFMDYPTDTLHVMVQGEDVEVTSTRLSPDDPIIMETGEQYIYFNGGSFDRGDTVDVCLSSLAGDSSLVFIIIGAVAVVVIIGCIAYFMMRKRAQALSPTK